MNSAMRRHEARDVSLWTILFAGLLWACFASCFCPTHGQEVMLAAWRFNNRSLTNATYVDNSVEPTHGISEPYYKGFNCKRNWDIAAFQCASNATTFTESVANAQAFYMAFAPKAGYAHRLTRLTFDATANAYTGQTRGLAIYSMVADVDFPPSYGLPAGRYVAESYLLALPFVTLQPTSIYPTYESFEVVFPANYTITLPPFQAYNLR